MTCAIRAATAGLTNMGVGGTAKTKTQGAESVTACKGSQKIAVWQRGGKANDGRGGEARVGADQGQLSTALPGASR